MNTIILRKMALIGFALSSSTVFATGAPVQHQFVGGQAASASQVNQNFQELADRIADLPSTLVYDYNNYKTTATSKTFNRSGGGCGSNTVVSQVDNYVRTVNATTTEVAVTETLNDANGVCRKRTRNYTETPTGKNLVSRSTLDIGTDSILDTAVLTDPAEILNSTMRQSTPFADASVSNSTTFDINGNPTSTSNGWAFIQTATVLAIEDITVPAGSYTSCLKVHSNRTSTHIGSFNRISWLCPGVGMVKRFHHNLVSGGSHSLELQSITP